MEPNQGSPLLLLGRVLETRVSVGSLSQSITKTWARCCFADNQSFGEPHPRRESTCHLAPGPKWPHSTLELLSREAWVDGAHSATLRCLCSLGHSQVRA